VLTQSLGCQCSAHLAQRIVESHVEGVVAAEHDAICPDCLDEVPQGRPVMDDGVVPDLVEIGRVTTATASCFRTDLPSVIGAADGRRQVTASVSGDDLQPRVAVEDAGEDQM